MSNTRLMRRAEWDGTFTLLLDGEAVLTRKPLETIEEAEAYLGAKLALPSTPPRVIPEEDWEPTLRDTGEMDPPSLR
jgi:hypothetical protein